MNCFNITLIKLEGSHCFHDIPTILFSERHVFMSTSFYNNEVIVLDIGIPTRSLFAITLLCKYVIFLFERSNHISNLSNVSCYARGSRMLPGICHYCVSESLFELDIVSLPKASFYTISRETLLGIFLLCSKQR